MGNSEGQASDALSAEAIRLSAVRDLRTTARSIRTTLSSRGAAIPDESRAQLENLADAVEHLAELFSLGKALLDDAPQRPTKDETPEDPLTQSQPP